MMIKNFPELRQVYSYDCGATALQAVLIYYGFDVREDKLMELAKTNKDGSSPENILKVFKHFKLKAKLIRRMSLAELKRYLDQGRPVIIALQAWSGQKKDYAQSWIDGHYVVAIGYDHQKIYFEDPSSVNRTYLSHQELLTRWHDCDANGKKYYNLGIVALGNIKQRVKAEKML
jgi:ABC-type bacteriocin/lantibiotic exporter with double-glycine peptidase domain